jgi:hypothetical protein
MELRPLLADSHIPPATSLQVSNGWHEYFCFCYGSCKFIFDSGVTKKKKRVERRYAIKFYVELREGSIDTYAKIQRVFGNDSVSSTSVAHNDFVNGGKTGKTPSLRN